MDEAIAMGKASATGSFKLFIGRIISTIVLAVGTIFVGRYISQGDYGLYTVAMVPAATFLLFQDWGVNFALTKYCANYRASKMDGELRNVIVSGFIFMILTGLALTLFSLLSASFIASVFGKPETAFLIAVSSITILSTALSSFSISVITGFERMGINSIMIFMSAMIQGLLSPLMVFLGFGAFGAVVGVTVASVASAITGLAMLYVIILRKLPSGILSKAKIFKTLKPLLQYGIPISIATLLQGLSLQVGNFMVAAFVDATMIGNFTIATNFAVLLGFFIFPLQTVLFPAFSKLDPLKDKSLLKAVFSSSVKYSSLFLAPATIALMVLSGPMVSTLYGDKWPHAPLFLTLYVAANLVVLIGNISYGRLLYAMGETKILLKLSFIMLCITVPITFLLVPTFGIVGAIVGVNIIAASTYLIICIYWTRKHYEAQVDYGNSARILLASILAGLTAYLFLSILNAASWIMLSIGSLLYLLVYLILIPFLGAINKIDIANLRVMFSDLGPVSKLLDALLKLIEKPLIFKENHAKMIGQN